MTNVGHLDQGKHNRSTTSAAACVETNSNFSGGKSFRRVSFVLVRTNNPKILIMMGKSSSDGEERVS